MNKDLSAKTACVSDALQGDIAREADIAGSSSQCDEHPNADSTGVASSDASGGVPDDARDLLVRGLAECSVLLDSRLGTVGMGERVRMAIGSVAGADSIGEFLPAPDAFRLEAFTKRASGYEELSSLELTLSGVPGFTHARALRTELFGAGAILLTLYPSKRDFLLANENLEAANILPASEKGILSRLETAHKMADIFSQSHSGEAAFIHSVLDELASKTLASSVICSIIVHGDSSSHPMYSMRELASRAVGHVKRSLSGADIALSSYAAEMDDGIAASGIPAEHMWYLTTCVLTTAVKLSGHGRTLLELTSKDERLILRVVSPASAFTARLPEHMTISELKNVVPASSLRLFLCDLICEEYKAACSVHCGSDMLEITFEFTPHARGRSFHRFDPVLPFDKWEQISHAVIIPDTPSPARD